MMQSVNLILACLLQLWLGFVHLKDNLVVVCLLKLATVLIVSMLLLVVSSSMSVKRQALASEQEASEHLVVQSAKETLTIQELFRSIKCSKVQQEVVVKEECATEPLPCTIPFGTWKLKIC